MEFTNKKNWRKTNHPFVPGLIRRLSRLSGDEKARALMGLAHAFWEEDEYADAISAVDEAKRFWIKLDDAVELAGCDQYAAMYLRDGSRYEEALERAELARKSWLSVGNIHKAAECTVMTAWILAHLDRPEEAFAKLDIARAMFMEAGSTEYAKKCLRAKAEIPRFVRRGR